MRRTYVFLAACAALLVGFCVALYTTSAGATATGFALIAVAFGVMTASAPKDAPPCAECGFDKGHGLGCGAGDRTEA